MSRGKAEPGFKTMIDSLYPAVEAFRLALDAGENDRTVLERVKMQQKTGQRVRGRWKPEKAGPAICFQKDRGIWIRGRSPCPTSSVVFVTI